MDKILKSLRETASMTQEAVADNLGISVNTLQNWERYDSLTKESLHNLMDLYGLDQQQRNNVVLEIFGKPHSTSEIPNKDNLPYFLLNGRQDVIEVAQRAVLSFEEMELFGYSYYGYGSSKCMLGYALFKDYGGYFHTMDMIRHIESKIGGYMTMSDKGICDFVYNYGLQNPGKGFSFCQLDATTIENEIGNLPETALNNPVEIKNLGKYCKAVCEPIFLGTSTKKNNEIDSIVKTSIVDAHSEYYQSNFSYSLKLNEICSQCFEIQENEISDPEYLEKKAQYLSDREAYDEHPDLYDRAPSFKYEYEYWLKLTEIGEQYIKWMES